MNTLHHQRPLSYVPKYIFILLIASVSLQILWHHLLPPPQVQVKPLTPPPPTNLLKILSFGEEVVTAKILMLWLQSFTVQQGQFISYQQLDYQILHQWLEKILKLDPYSQYPLLAASYQYSYAANPKKQREMLEFIYESFFSDPKRRWRWLAQASIIAKHQLKDLPLALRYAQALTRHTDKIADLPAWAREMEIFILEDMGELKQAKLIVGGLLASGQITNKDEIIFLNQKLKELEARLMAPK